MYSSTTAAALEQKRKHVQHPTHRPTHPRTHHIQQAVREFVHADVTLLYRIGISMSFPCFHHPSPYRGPGTSPVDGPRSPLAEFGVGARSFTGDPEGCCVGRAWHCRAAAGGRVALGRAFPKRGILYTTVPTTLYLL